MTEALIEIDVDSEIVLQDSHENLHAQLQELARQRDQNDISDDKYEVALENIVEGFSRMRMMIDSNPVEVDMSPASDYLRDHGLEKCEFCPGIVWSDERVICFACQEQKEGDE